MNRTVLVGRLVKDPELRYTPNGVAVASFVIAVNRTFTNQQGEREVDFINCVVWRKAAENVANYLKKGSLAGVDGRIQTRSYDGQDGKRVFVVEVIAESVQFLDTRNNDSQSNNRNNQSSNQSSQQNNNRGGYVDDPFAPGSQIDISDDDLPF